MTDDRIEAALDALAGRLVALEREVVAQREKIIRLEGKVDNNTRAEDKVSERLEKIDANMTMLLGVLNQAKGARWALLGLVALGGGGVYAFFQRLLGMPPPGAGP